MKLTKKDTRILKGIAILLMLSHHLFTFPSRIPAGFEIPSLLQIEGMSIERAIGTFGRICVSLYMFLGGYGIYKYMESGGVLYTRVVKMYQSYWKVFFIFVPIGFLFCSNQPVYCEESILCNVFSNFNLNEWISNFIGWKCSYNREWWFFKTYLFTMFLGYIWMEKRKEKKGFWLEVFEIIVFEILIRNLFPALKNVEILKSLNSDPFYTNLFTINVCSVSYFMGMIFAKYEEMEIGHRFRQYPKWKRNLGSVFGVFFMVYMRNFILGSVFDLFYVPCFILLVFDLLDQHKVICNILEILGKYSTSMWLIHGFYCYYFYGVVKIVYGAKNALVDFLILTGLSFVSAIVIDEGYQYVRKIAMEGFR